MQQICVCVDVCVYVCVCVCVCMYVCVCAGKIKGRYVSLVKYVGDMFYS